MIEPVKIKHFLSFFKCYLLRGKLKRKQHRESVKAFNYILFDIDSGLQTDHWKLLNSFATQL